MRDQEIGMSALFIMTVWNILLGIVMITGIITVWFGLTLAFVGMFAIVYIAWRLLMGDERPWETRKKYIQRTNKG